MYPIYSLRVSDGNCYGGGDGPSSNTICICMYESSLGVIIKERERDGEGERERRLYKRSEKDNTKGGMKFFVEINNSFTI